MRLLRGVRDRYEARAIGHPTLWSLLCCMHMNDKKTELRNKLT
jgi:hypothetical protein